MSGDQDHRPEHYNFIFHDEPFPFIDHKPSSGAPGGGAYYEYHDAPQLAAAPSTTTSFLSITDLLRSSMVDYMAAAASSDFGLSSSSWEPPAAVGTVGSDLMLDVNTLSAASNIPPPPPPTTLGCGGGASTPLTPNSSTSSSSTEAGAGEEEHLKPDQEEVKQQPEEVDTDQGDMSKKLDKPKKKGEKRARDPSFAFVTQSEVDHLEDGYRWRKYGQKAVKNSPYPRSYYRCTTQKCPVKKRVERCYQNPSIVITTYEGRHTHNCPTTLRGSGHFLPSPQPLPPPSQVMPASFCHDLMMQQVLQRLDDDDDKFSQRGDLNPSALLQNLPPSLQRLPFQDFGFFHG
ncbi:WRKY transcription factor 28-like [Zingiber officinale]|uniref:WRKY domain-containing protein n=1 Tax=Zingiber officinale TaxID=94328 RepID=A0A8J5FHF5_ZINOF|nr:WRKY transcription factor 28-like [Zingiber officinale]KAG6488082.1 hypothetical protein ZIOFF_056840 [Zingiber officinale]